MTALWARAVRAGGTAAGVTVPVAAAGVTGAAAAAVFASAGWSAAGLSALVFALAAALAGTRSITANVPAALLSVLAAVTVVAQIHVGGMLPLSDAWTARGVLVSGAILVAFAAVRRGRGGRRVRLAAPAELVACLPAVGVGAAGVWLLTAGATSNTWSFLRSGDNGAHIRYVGDLIHKGYLDYVSGEAYPRALHAFIAWLQTAAAGYPGAAPAETVARTTSAAVWALYVLLTATTGLIAVRLCAGRSRRIAAAAGAGAGLTMLLSPFFGFAVGYGFQTSVLLSLTLAVSGLEMLTLRSGSVRPLLMASVTLLVAAHTWQLALPALGVCWLGCVIYSARAASASSARAWGGAVGVAVIAAVACLPALAAILTLVGVGGVAAPGSAPRLALEWLVPGALLAVWCAARFRRDPRAALFAGSILLTVATAVGLGGLVGASPLAYYPKKLLWEAAVLCVPLVWAAVVPLCVGVVRMVSREGVLRFAVPAALFVAGGVFTVLAVATPMVMTLAGPR